LGEYGTNQSLKKYVAKKTVQEQAFRGTGYASDETSKKNLADLAAPKIVQQTTAGSNVGLFAKPAETAAAGGGSGGSGLFKNDGAAASGQSTTSSSLFGNLNKPAADSGSQTTAAAASATTENKSSGLFGPAGGATENKSSGLFGNITEKKAEAAAAQKPADNAQKPTDTSTSLFGNSGSSASSSLFGPGAISSNAPKTQAPTTPAPTTTQQTTVYRVMKYLLNSSIRLHHHYLDHHQEQLKIKVFQESVLLKISPKQLKPNLLEVFLPISTPLLPSNNNNNLNLKQLLVVV